MWNQAVHTDREVTTNRPDIIIKNKKEKTRTLIDVAIPADRNVVQKQAEKKLKYKSLCIEVQRMWNLKCTIVPVIIGAAGIVTRSLRKNLETIPRKLSTDSLQKTAILGTSHTIRKVLQCEAWSLSGGDHRWFKRSTGKKCLWQETSIIIIITATSSSTTTTTTTNPDSVTLGTGVGPLMHPSTTDSISWSPVSAKFKVALRKYFNTHSFYFVDEFFICKDYLYYCFINCLWCFTV